MKVHMHRYLLLAVQSCCRLWRSKVRLSRLADHTFTKFSQSRGGASRETLKPCLPQLYWTQQKKRRYIFQLSTEKKTSLLVNIPIHVHTTNLLFPIFPQSVNYEIWNLNFISIYIIHSIVIRNYQIIYKICTQ